MRGCLTLIVGVFLFLLLIAAFSGPNNRPAPRPVAQPAPEPLPAAQDNNEAEEPDADALAAAAEQKRIEAERKAEEERVLAARGDKFDAQAYTQRKILHALDFPDDSSFPWFGHESKYVDHYKGWLCTGKVKAKNVFGAELTYSYRGVVRFHADAGFWELIQLYLNDVEIYDRLLEDIEERERLARAETSAPEVKLGQKPDLGDRIDAVRAAREQAKDRESDPELIARKARARVAQTKVNLERGLAGSLERDHMEWVIETLPEDDPLHIEAKALLGQLK